MSFSQPIRRIAVVGTGVIGAALGLLPVAWVRRGRHRSGTNAEANLRKYVDNAWPALGRAGLPVGISRERLTFTANMSRAFAEADLVQENAQNDPSSRSSSSPRWTKPLPPDAIIASSSSGITMDVMQSACRHPRHCVIGHPFNPPHIVPLVEGVGGAEDPPRR